MTKKTTAGLEEIARAAGVSKMTVSRVLRGGTGFSEDTRDKVLREVDRLRYVPNRLAAAFGTTGASTLVGVCVPRLTSRLFAEVLETIDHTLSRLGYQTMIGSHDQKPEAEEEWLKSLVSWRPAGVILSSREHSRATLELLQSAAVPVVEIWDLNTRPIDLSVGFSHGDCGFEMGRFLVGRGRQRMGFVGALAGAGTQGHARREGFARALAEGGLRLEDSEILHDRPGFYAGYYGTETILSRRPDLDALYFHDDEMAIGGLAYCAAKGITVPGRLAIAGWGGMEAASILPKRLTTTVVPTINLGKSAAELLVARLRGEPCPDVTLIATRLVPGATA
jgi:LacI family transcriptional regulator, gluconate utilization system Gnt-I transcriptional repressor